MGTNYYAYIIPVEEKKEELHAAINNNDFYSIRDLVDEMYSMVEYNWPSKKISGGKVHLGKRSGGWKFLWNPNVYTIRGGHFEFSGSSKHYVPDPTTLLYLYPLTKQGLHDFIFRKDILIYNEYRELQDKEEFWKMALSWEQEDGWDDNTYQIWEKNRDPNFKEWASTGELINLLEKEGYEFTSSAQSDFYSDGLRFATSIDFC
jgi:hypothetical protein